MQHHNESRLSAIHCRHGIVGVMCLREVGAIVLLIGGLIWGLTQIGAMTSLRPLADVGEHPGSVSRLECSADGELWVIRKFHGLYRRSPAEDSEEQVLPHRYPLNDVAVHSDDDATIWAIGRYDGVFEIWWNDRIVLETRSNNPEGLVRSVTFADDGRLLVGVTLSGRLLVYRRTGSTYVLDRDQQIAQSIDSVSVSKDGRFAACSSLGRHLIVWDLQHNRLVSAWESLHSCCSDIEWSHDGKLLATVGSAEPRGIGGNLSLWDAATGEMRWNVRADVVDPNAIVFAPSGDRLFTGGFDKRVRVWDATNGELLEELVGHQGPVRTLSLAPRGDCVYSGSLDGRILSWRL